MIEFLFSTGCRVGELCNLLIEKINKKNHRGYFYKCKKNSDRWFYMQPKFSEKLWNFIEAQQKRFPNVQYVFHQGKGNKVLTKSVEDLIKKFSDNKEIIREGKFITPHSFRRSYATILNKNGVKIILIMKKMGHKKITTT